MTDQRARIAGSVVAVVTAVLWAGSLYFSKSRAAIVAAMVCGAVAVVAILPGRRRKLMAGAVCLMAGGAFFVVVHQGRSFSSLQARSHYWNAAVRMTVENPVAGKGLYEFFPHYMRYKRGEMEETRLPHNAVLALSSQAGVLAALVFAMFAMCGVRSLLSVFSERRRLDRGLQAVCALGFLAWWLHALTDLNLNIPGSFVTAGVLLALSVPDATAAVGDGDDDGACRGRRRLAHPVWIAFFAIVVLAGAWRMPAQRLYRYLTEARPTPANAALMARAAARVSQRDPFTPYPWIYVGKVAQSMERYSVAAECLKQALARAPHRSSLWFRLAECRLNLGDEAGAATAFAKARQWYPEATKYAEFEERLKQRRH